MSLLPQHLSALKKLSTNMHTPGLKGRDFLKQRRDNLTSCIKGQG